MLDIYNEIINWKKGRGGKGEKEKQSEREEEEKDNEQASWRDNSTFPLPFNDMLRRKYFWNQELEKKERDKSLHIMKLDEDGDGETGISFQVLGLGSFNCSSFQRQRRGETDKYMNEWVKKREIEVMSVPTASEHDRWSLDSFPFTNITIELCNSYRVSKEWWGERVNLHKNPLAREYLSYYYYLSPLCLYVSVPLIAPSSRSLSVIYKKVNNWSEGWWFS